MAALAANAPEITSAVTALSRGQASVGAGIVIGSNVFNLAALLGLAAVVAGWIGFHRRVVVLAGIPAVWIAAVCLLTVGVVVGPWGRAGPDHGGAGAVCGGAGHAAGADGAPAGRRARWVRWLVAAVHEEETELLEAIRPRRGGWRDALAAVAALIVVIGASTVMEVAATALGRRYAVADIITGGLVLAVVTSLPNAVSAVYLARRGRGAAVLSTALNSNAINVVAGLLIPACLAGLGPRSGPGTLVGRVVCGPDRARARAGVPRKRPGPHIRRGDHRGIPGLRDRPDHHRGPRNPPPGHGRHRGRRDRRSRAVPLTWPRRSAMASPDYLWQQESVLPGWSIGRLWRLSLISCTVIAACSTPPAART